MFTSLIKFSWFGLVVSLILSASLTPSGSVALAGEAQPPKPTAPSASPEVPPSVNEVRELLQQLDSMTDAVRQTTAEQLGARLLSELECRPEIERLRGERTALQDLHTRLTESLDRTSKQLEAQRARLKKQLREIEANGKADGATIERRKAAALQSGAPAIRQLQANQAEYTKQLKELTQRIERCEANESALTDQLALSLEGGYIPTAPKSLPREVSRPNKRMGPKPSSPSDKASTVTSGQLIQELGIEP